MSSTLMIRKTPKPDEDQYAFKYPIKGMIARRYYNHDGSLGGQMITLNSPLDLVWFEGILAAGNFDLSETAKLEKIIEILRDGNSSIDMWFEV